MLSCLFFTPKSNKNTCLKENLVSAQLLTLWILNCICRIQWDEMQFERGSFTAGSHVWKAFCILSISRRGLCTKDAKRWPLLQIGFLHPKIEYVGLRTHFCLNRPSLAEFSQHPNWFPELKDWMGWPENCVSAKIFGKHLVNVNVPANVTGTLDLQWVHCAQGNTRWFESSHSCQCKNMSMPMWHRRNRVSVYATNMTLFWYWTIT